VPTKDGWVLVNPYMTLVTAYERLIAGRGIEIKEDTALTSQAAVPETASVPPEYKTPPGKVQKSIRGKRIVGQSKTSPNLTIMQEPGRRANEPRKRPKTYSQASGSCASRSGGISCKPRL
jgi:hypothetical protein